MCCEVCKLLHLVHRARMRAQVGEEWSVSPAGRSLAHVLIEGLHRGERQSEGQCAIIPTH